MSDARPAIPVNDAARILVVDDEIFHMQALSDTLRERGYHVVGVTSGKEALATLRLETFDVLLTDLTMPEMDGIGLVQAALQIDPQLVGIIMTGAGTLTSAVEAMRVGALDYVLKPFRISILQRVLTRALAVHQLRIENRALEKSLRDHALELETANQELEMATRAKSTFLATMSHEIRTPMNGMLGMLELLSLTSLDGQQRTKVEIVRQSGRSLLRVIDDILEFSKLEAGKLTIRNEVTAVAVVIRNVCALYSGAAASKGLALTSVVDDKISPAVWIDSQRLQQILNNFVSNAIKFTSSGFVEIRADLVEQSTMTQVVCFTVADTGIGIAHEDQQQLFEPFTQADAQITRRFGGTGLGLSICKRLAALMDGAIKMESAPNVGTTLHLTLSMQVADAALLADHPVHNAGYQDRANVERRIAPTVEQAIASGTLVLVVDDHGINRMVLTQQITTLGYAVETAEDGLDGFERWKSGRFGLVLSDCHMPVMDGYEMVRRIRAHETSTGSIRTPVIACTANALAEEAEKCYSAGMDDYLAKPLELRDLALKLRQWLPVASSGAPVVVETSLKVAACAEPIPAPAVDLTVLAALSRGNPATQREMVDLFRKINDQDTIALRKNVMNRDAPATVHTAHRIKGAARILGAFGLADLVERIEKTAPSHDWQTVTADMTKFETELDRVNDFLDSLC